MLFLITFKENKIPNYPNEIWLGMITQFLDSMISYSEQGRIVAQGGYAGREDGFCIFNVESSEELNEILMIEPAWQYLDKEIIPLISLEDMNEVLKRKLSSVIES